MNPVTRFESSRELDQPIKGESSQVFLANSKHSNRRPPEIDEEKPQKLKNKTLYRRYAFTDAFLVAGVSNLKVWSVNSGEQVSTISLSDAKVTEVGQFKNCSFTRLVLSLEFLIVI